MPRNASNHILSLLYVGAIACMTAWVSPSLAGTSSGGGNGALCIASGINHDHPLLVDFLGRHPPVIDLPDDRDRLTEVADRPSTGRLGFEPVEIEKTQAYQDAMRKLDDWARKSPASAPAVKKLRDALKRIVFGKINRRYRDTLRTVIAPDSPCARPGASKSVIRYVANMALISVPFWNAAGPKSRMGILLHAAGRRIQLDEAYDGDDADLQRFIAHLVLDTPKPNQNLSDSPFFTKMPLSTKTEDLKIELCASAYPLLDHFSPADRRKLYQLCGESGVANQELLHGLDHKLLEASRCLPYPAMNALIAKVQAFSKQYGRELAARFDRIRAADKSLAQSDSKLSRQAWNRIFSRYDAYLNHKLRGEEREKWDELDAAILELRLPAQINASTDPYISAQKLAEADQRANQAHDAYLRSAADDPVSQKSKNLWIKSIEMTNIYLNDLLISLREGPSPRPMNNAGQALVRYVESLESPNAALRHEAASELAQANRDYELSQEALSRAGRKLVPITTEMLLLTRTIKSGY